VVETYLRVSTLNNIHIYVMIHTDGLWVRRPLQCTSNWITVTVDKYAYGRSASPRQDQELILVDDCNGWFYNDGFVWSLGKRE